MSTHFPSNLNIVQRRSSNLLQGFTSLVSEACADPGIFGRGGGGGGPGQTDKKKALTFFFCFFLVLSLFYRSQMVNFKEIYIFFKVPEGVQHFPGGGGGVFPTFSGGGGVQLLIPYRNPYNL